MNHEIRLRVPRSFYIALSSAAAMRGVAVSALVSMVAHEFLHAHGELAPTQVEPKPVPPSVADMSEWLDDEDEPLNVGS